MSDNGDGEAREEPATEIGRLIASIEVCAIRSERALEEAQSARHASERTERVVADVARTLKRIADDHFEIRSGVPVSWRDRAALVAICSATGALIAAVVARLAG